VGDRHLKFYETWDNLDVLATRRVGLVVLVPLCETASSTIKLEGGPMARRADDAQVVLRMTKAERDLVNQALGRGRVNDLAVRLLVDYARAIQRAQPALTNEEVTSAA